MSGVHESDWELVNAYADGELPPDEARQVLARLAREPELAEALAEVTEVKRSLGALRPARPANPPSRLPRRGWLRRLAVAASLAAVLALGVLYGMGRFAPDWQTVPAAFHAELSARSYVLDPSAPIPVVSTARIGDVAAFDLSGSRLALVDLRTGREAGRDVVAMHYRGRNGCRLTVVALEARPDDPEPLPEVHHGLAARWSLERLHYYILADGMDHDRFSAIAGYAEAESRRLHDVGRLRLAMGAATAQARPCA